MPRLPLAWSALVVLAVTSPARAQVEIEGVRWQVTAETSGRKPVYHDVSQWHFPPTLGSKLRPRAMVRLLNRNPKAQTAVLLRYSFSAKLKSIAEGSAEGIWTVPFILEERHIPSVKGGSSQEVPLNVNRIALAGYLKRMHRAGYWPEALRLQVMVEPRSGDGLANRVREESLTVLWKPASGNNGQGGR